MKKSHSNHTREVIKEQILVIRDSGEANMLDIKTVQRIADERDYDELICYTRQQPKDYYSFIISGDENFLPK